MELDAGLYERQMAGIAALISLANDVAVATRSSEIVAPTAEPRQGRLRGLIERLRQDQMTLNSLYLVLNTGLQAGFGFGFWIITTHLFNPGDVGKASALVSATGLIGSFALFGLNTGMGKYLPESRKPDALISSGLSLVAVCGAVGAGIYLLLIPFIAPDLSFVEKSPMMALGFALITSAEAVNTLTDSIFIAARRAVYTLIVDGIIGGFGKVILAIVLAGAGTYALFAASASGLVLAGLVSLFLIFAVMRIRLDLERPLATLKPLFRFTGANYIGNILNMFPGLAVPIIILDRLGDNSSGYFFVVFQVVQIVYAAALALEQTFLAEGSRADADMRALRRRSLRMLLMFCLPAALGIIVLGRWVLLVFGRQYVGGYGSLVVLSLAAGPIAANYWYLSVLRLAGKLRAIVIVNATYAVATCAFVWIGTSHGLTGVATGWFFGALAATCAAALASREGRPRDRQESLEPGTPGAHPARGDCGATRENGQQPWRPARPSARRSYPGDGVGPRPGHEGAELYGLPEPWTASSGGYAQRENGADRGHSPRSSGNPGHIDYQHGTLHGKRSIWD